MAKKSKLKDAAVKIGSIAGKVDGTAHMAAHKAALAAEVAHEELAELSKQVDALKKQLASSVKKLKAALK